VTVKIPRLRSFWISVGADSAQQAEVIILDRVAPATRLKLAFRAVVNQNEVRRSAIGQCHAHIRDESCRLADQSVELDAECPLSFTVNDLSTTGDSAESFRQNKGIKC